MPSHARRSGGSDLQGYLEGENRSNTIAVYKRRTFLSKEKLLCIWFLLSARPRTSLDSYLLARLAVVGCKYCTQDSALSN